MISIFFYIAVVTQDYETDVPKVYVINGNSALLKCVIPSIVADFIRIESWTDDDNNEFFPNTNFGNMFFYTHSKVISMKKNHTSSKYSS